MPESESAFYFLGVAQDFYESINSVEQVIEVWDHIAFLQDYNDIDYTSVFEISDGLDWYKVMYGPVYTIVFQTEPDGSLTFLSIRRSGFLRLDG